jgi:hypothetical protein
VLKPRRGFLPVPTFLEYEKACLEQQAQIVRYYLPEEEDFRVTDALIDFLKRRKRPLAGNSLFYAPEQSNRLLIEPPLLDRILSCCKDLNIGCCWTSASWILRINRGFTADCKGCSMTRLSLC